AARVFRLRDPVGSKRSSCDSFITALRTRLLDPKEAGDCPSAARGRLSHSFIQRKARLRPESAANCCVMKPLGEDTKHTSAHPRQGSHDRPRVQIPTKSNLVNQ
ncbi:hypothetical protein LEMLEM_LOCUS6790, partial [Lemmus lemmus]